MSGPRPHCARIGCTKPVPAARLRHGARYCCYDHQRQAAARRQHQRSGTTAQKQRGELEALRAEVRRLRQRLELAEYAKHRAEEAERIFRRPVSAYLPRVPKRVRTTPIGTLSRSW